MLNLEVRTINKWTNQPDIWVAGKCMLPACYKDIFAQTAARTCRSEPGMPVEFEVYNFT